MSALDKLREMSETWRAWVRSELNIARLGLFCCIVVVFVAVLVNRVERLQDRVPNTTTTTQPAVPSPEPSALKDKSDD